MGVDEATMLSMLRSAKAAFLLEPPYKRKYPPLGLGKLASYLRENGTDVQFGRTYEGQQCDLVCVTTLFTFESEAVFAAIDSVRFFNSSVPILMGGVFASLMPRVIEKRYPGIHLFTGYSPTLDQYPPDYELATDVEEPWSRFSYVFTSRGCPNKCPYCAVWRIEPGRWVNPAWRDAIVDDRPYVMISDNNLSVQPMGHIEEVIVHCAEKEKRILFDNGFDCKHISAEMAELLARAKYTRKGMRLAFDRIEEDGTFQTAVERLIEAGVPKSQIMAYVLFNFTDTPEDADYRMRECVRLGIRPYPQVYEPLNILDRKRRFVGKHWSKRLLGVFRRFWLMNGFYTRMTFKDYLRQEGLEALWR